MYKTHHSISLVPRPSLTAADGLHHCYRRSGDVIHPLLRIVGLGTSLPFVGINIILCNSELYKNIIYEKVGGIWD